MSSRSYPGLCFSVHWSIPAGLGVWHAEAPQGAYPGSRCPQEVLGPWATPSAPQTCTLPRGETNQEPWPGLGEAQASPVVPHPWHSGLFQEFPW